MNRLFTNVFWAACLVASFAIVPSAAANVLPNSGFENGSTWNTGDNHQIVTTNPRSGSRSLQITSTGSNHSTFSDTVSANQGDEYVFSSYVRALNLVAGPNGPGDTPIALVRFRDGNAFVRNAHGARVEGYRWAPYIQQQGTYPYTNNGMQLRFQMTQTGDGFDVGLRSWMHNTSGLTWWDDLSVTKLTFPDRGNLLGTYQAEDANQITRGFVDDEELEFTGSGYVDVTDNNATIRWNNVVGGGDRVVSVRYSWEGFVRDIELIINGQSVETKDGVPTGRRGIYATLDFDTVLPAGNNTVQLVVGRGGGPLGQPLIDKIDVYQKAGSGGGGPTVPAVPANVQASDGQFTDRIRVTWNAPSGATSYEAQRRLGTSGAGSSVPTGSGGVPELDDFTVDAGVTYQYRVQACNSAGCSNFSGWDSGTRATSGGSGGGSLSTVLANGSGTEDISANATDFLKLGAPEVRLANVARQIFDVTGIGGTDGIPHTTGQFRQTWTNGDPIAQSSGNGSKAGLRVFNNGKGLSFTAAAGTESRNLRLYFTGRGLGSEALDTTITATLSDSSAPVSTVDIVQSGTAKFGRVVTFTYTAAADGQVLTVEMLKNGGNFASIDALSLTGGTPGSTNLPPAFDPVADQTITAGDLLFIDLLATDPEGAAITLTKTDDLPGANAVLTDFGNGVGEIEWNSAAGDAGSYTISVTAEDANSASSTIDIPVTVLPAGGSNGSLSATASQVTDRNQTLSGSYIKYAPTASIDEAFNSNGTQPFSPITRLGGALGARTSAGFVRYSYTGATPANGSSVRGGNRIFDPAPIGLAMEIDADSSPRSATVYVGVRNAIARAVISMSDGSAAPVIVDMDRLNQSAVATFAIEIDFQAGAANQAVEVELFLQATGSGSPIGWTSFEAAEQ